jgi:phage repressor protein C with HTH and peptisase S24 domain
MIDDSQHDSTGSQQSSQQDLSAANLYEARFSRLLEAVNATNDTGLGKALGIKQQSVASAHERKQVPSKWIIAISEKFGISSDWLLFGEPPKYRKQRSGQPTASDMTTEERCLSAEQYILVPLLESWVRGGPEGEIIFDGIADYYPFKKWWVERLIGKSPERKKSLYMVKVRGDSMTPTINHGESVLVDTSESERIKIRTGDIYLVTMPDGATSIKRLAYSNNTDGKMRLICMSDNIGVYRPFDFVLDPERRIQDYVLARVRWAGKEFD